MLAIRHPGRAARAIRELGPLRQRSRTASADASASG